MAKTIEAGLVMLAVALASSAVGKIAWAEDFPAQIQLEEKTLKLSGVGNREGGINRIKVYKAALYLETPSRNFRGILRSKETKRLVLKFDIQVNRDTIQGAWREGFERHAKGELGALGARIEKLLGWMSAVQPGDAFEFTYNAELGIEAKIKGQTKGVLEGEDFARVFFSIWLGTPPVDFKLKEALLARR